MIGVFLVKPGYRYRFRAAFSGSINNFPVTLRIDNHHFKVIALDGNSIMPYEANSVTFAKGERVDFVLKARHERGAYLMKVSSDCDVRKLEGTALIEYDDDTPKDYNSERVIEVNTEEDKTVGRGFNTELCDSSKLGKVCLSDVVSLKKMPKDLKTTDTDKKLYLSYNYKDVSSYLGE